MNWFNLLWCSDCNSQVHSAHNEQWCECLDNEIEDEDPCICIPDEPNLNCESCF